MRSLTHIALILPDTLQSAGLRTLLADYFAPVEIGLFESYDQLAEAEKETFDCYFTSPEILSQHLDFFMLKRSRTVLVVDRIDPAEAATTPFRLAVHTSIEAVIEQLHRLLGHVSGADNPDTGSALSTREIDVLRLIVSGLTNREIADRLYISLNTVLTHRKNITAKLGIKTVPGLTLYAIANGLATGEQE